MNRILITGGAGFIGSHVVERLLAAGNKVRVLDSFSSGKEINLKGLDVEVIQGSILDRELLDRAMKDVHGVVHLAACVSVPESIKDPVRCTEVNVRGTQMVLDACLKHGVGRFVQASSSAVYGNLPQQPKTEVSPVEFMSPYAESKYLAEGLAHSAHSESLRCTSLRFFNVYGPRQDPSSAYSGVISIFLSRIMNMMPITFFGDGGQTRDFIHVQDVATYICGCFERRPELHETLNVATGQSISLLRMAEVIQEEIGHSVPFLFAPPRPGDVYHSSASVSKLRALDAHRTRSFAEGIRETIEWLEQTDPRFRRRSRSKAETSSTPWLESQVRFS